MAKKRVSPRPSTAKKAAAKKPPEITVVSRPTNIRIVQPSQNEAVQMMLDDEELIQNKWYTGRYKTIDGRLFECQNTVSDVRAELRAIRDLLMRDYFAKVDHGPIIREIENCYVLFSKAIDSLAKAGSEVDAAVMEMGKEGGAA